MRNAIIISDNDNVIVAVEPISEGDPITYVLSDGTEKSLRAAENIPIYHKVAACDIEKAGKIIKYGECIGQAIKEIRAGGHVHTENVVSYQA